MVYSTMAYEPPRQHFRYMVSVAKRASEHGFLGNFELQTDKNQNEKYHRHNQSIVPDRAGTMPPHLTLKCAIYMKKIP